MVEAALNPFTQSAGLRAGVEKEIPLQNCPQAYCCLRCSCKWYLQLLLSPTKKHVVVKASQVISAHEAENPARASVQDSKNLQPVVATSSCLMVQLALPYCQPWRKISLLVSSVSEHGIRGSAILSLSSDKCHGLDIWRRDWSQFHSTGFTGFENHWNSSQCY